jgi:L-alanine-DL-glutamate epimerase-like enolase superfamily enzyme
LRASKPYVPSLGIVSAKVARYSFRDVIEHRSVSALNPDFKFVEGVSQFMIAAAVAQAHDLPIAPQGIAELHTYVAAANPSVPVRGACSQIPKTRSGTPSSASSSRMFEGSVAIPDELGSGNPYTSALDRHRAQ